MATLRVALLQLTSHGFDQAANLAKGDEWCRRAQAMGADVALFPELWNIGYPFAGDAGPADPRQARDPSADDLWRAPERWSEADRSVAAPIEGAIARWRDLAIERDGPFIAHFRRLARELGMAIALTYLERWPGRPRNAMSLIDRHGEIVFTYAKVHTCDFSLDEAACTPGDDFFAGDLDTVAGLVRLGAMICYDREFPESARILMLKGAEIILTPNACQLEANRIGQFRARAFENMVGVAMANYAAPQQNGHSVAFDGMVCDERGNLRDPLVVEAGEVEGISLAPFDLTALRSYRRRETLGNAFRRPHRYGALTDPTIAPPFVRTNAAGDPYDPRTR